VVNGVELKDIGDFLEVPEDQREELDGDPVYNADAGFDVQVVPNGEYVELSTADDSEPLLSETDGDPLDGDGSPVEFLSANDPEAGQD
jgi:hypothetical protein